MAENPFGAGGRAVIFRDNESVAWEMTARPIANFEQIVRQWAAEGGLCVKNALALNDARASLLLRKDGIHVCCPIKRLRLDTFWINFGGHLVPRFDPHPQAVRLAPAWEVPAGMKLYLSVQCVPAEQGFKAPLVLLFARKEGVGGFFRLPLSNVYEDARVCMGDAWELVRKPDIVSLWLAAHQHVQDSTWNADLAPMGPHLANAQALFRFSANQEQQPVPDNWEALCIRVNRVEMEELFA